MHTIFHATCAFLSVLFFPLLSSFQGSLSTRTPTACWTAALPSARSFSPFARASPTFAGTPAATSTRRPPLPRPRRTRSMEAINSVEAAACGPIRGRRGTVCTRRATLRGASPPSPPQPFHLRFLAPTRFSPCFILCEASRVCERAHFASSMGVSSAGCSACGSSEGMSGASHSPGSGARGTQGR